MSELSTFHPRGKPPRIFYTAVGDVRGPCGHRHQSYKAAAKCAEKDKAIFRKQADGSYSDRRVEQRTY